MTRKEKSRRRFSESFRKEQVKLIEQGSGSISQISRLERGWLNPTISTLCALSQALEVRLTDMLDFEVADQEGYKDDS